MIEVTLLDERQFAIITETIRRGLAEIAKAVASTKE